jgi:hypothetical protein
MKVVETQAELNLELWAAIQAVIAVLLVKSVITAEELEQAMPIAREMLTHESAKIREARIAELRQKHGPAFDVLAGIFGIK